MTGVWLIGEFFAVKRGTQQSNSSPAETTKENARNHSLNQTDTPQKANPRDRCRRASKDPPAQTRPSRRADAQTAPHQRSSHCALETRSSRPRTAKIAQGSNRASQPISNATLSRAPRAKPQIAPRCSGCRSAQSSARQIPETSARQARTDPRRSSCQTTRYRCIAPQSYPLESSATCTKQPRAIWVVRCVAAQNRWS